MVLRAVGGVDLVVDVVRLDEENVLFHAADVNVCFAAVLGAAEPGGRAPVNGPDAEAVAVADDPDRHRLAQRAVASPWHDLQFGSHDD